MKILFWPFWSMQDKLAGKFQLEADGGIKLYASLAREAAEAGWKVSFVLPKAIQCEGALRLHPKVEVQRLRYYAELANCYRRLQWEPGDILRLTENINVVVTTHELLPIPLRQLRPKLRIAVERGFYPTEMHKLFDMALECSNLVHCVTETLRREVIHPRTTTWQLAYDNEIAEPLNIYRDIDVLFPARCSAVDYTNYKLFVDAFAGFRGRVVMTDPTSYLRKFSTCTFVTPQQLTRSEYTHALHRSQVVVGLSTNGSGGMAFREAAACGAVPVALKRPEYIEVLGEDWPYYCDPTPDSVLMTTLKAFKGWPTYGNAKAKIAGCSRANVWQNAKRDLEKLLCE